MLDENKSGSPKILESFQNIFPSRSERKSVEDQLSRQLEFQQLLMNISSEFINIPVGD
jgi:hypothetical protein